MGDFFHNRRFMVYDLQIIWLQQETLSGVTVHKSWTMINKLCYLKSTDNHSFVNISLNRSKIVIPILLEAMRVPKNCKLQALLYKANS